MLASSVLTHCGVINGPHSEFVLIDTDCQEEALGVQFRPGGTGPFLAPPAADLHNEVVSLDMLWGETASEFREQLLEARTVERRFQVVEHCLLARLAHPASYRPARRTHPTQSISMHPAVAFALKEFQDVASSPAIATVTDRIGMSQTHFIHVFRDTMGLTPKQYCRVRRFQETLRVLERGTLVDWNLHFDILKADREGLGNACIMRTPGDILFRELLGNISHLFLCLRKHNGKNETGSADLVTGRSAVSLA